MNKRNAGVLFALLAAFMAASAIFAVPAWAQAALTVVKTDAPDPVEEGETLTYTITVTNTGPTAQDVQLTDTLPKDVEFVSATPSQGACSRPTADAPLVVRCDLDNIAQSATVTIRVRPTEAVVGEQIVNRVEAQGTNTGLVPAKGEATTTVIPSLELFKDDDPDPVREDGLLAYTLTVENQGDAEAENFVVRDELPNGVEFVRAFADQGGECRTLRNETVVECAFSTLSGDNNNDSAEITILVVPTQQGTITNQASVFLTGQRNNPIDEVAEDTRVQGQRDRNDPFDPFDPDGPRGPFDPFDPDVDDDGIIDAIDDEIDEVEDLDDDELDEEDEDDIFGDDEDTDDGVSAEAGETDANAADDPNTDPDELAPVDEPLGEVEDEVNTEGIPLPPTGGLDFMVLALLAAPLILGLMTGGFLLMRGARR